MEVELKTINDTSLFDSIVTIIVLVNKLEVVLPDSYFI